MNSSPARVDDLCFYTTHKARNSSLDVQIKVSTLKSQPSIYVTCKAVAAFSEPTALLTEISLKTDVKSVDSRAKNNGTVVSSPGQRGKS